MTDYAYDITEHTLVTSWDTGIGKLSHVLAKLPTVVSVEDALRIASTLSELSTYLWRCYAQPASSASSMEPNTEGWRLQQEREAFARISDAILKPNLPQDGSLLVSYISVEEAAHRVGRALYAISAPALTGKIIRDVASEINAVECAERGDLTERAQQAVTLTRSDVSPLQVIAANAVFQEEPLGSVRLFEEVDATAAAVAAAHWLQAAANVTSAQTNFSPTAVLIEADNIEEVGTETPSIVLNMLDAGVTPRSVVINMVQVAMAVAKGVIPDPDGLMGEIKQAQATAAKYGLDDRELVLRLTPLDPLRPSHDLLEDLLSGIQACYLLYMDHCGYPDVDSAEAEFISALRAEAELSQEQIL